MRTIDIKLVEPAGRNRKPLWEAWDHYWPSIETQFHADDEGNGNLERIARRLLNDAERESQVD